MEDEVVAKGVEGGDGSDAALGEVESGAEGVLKGLDGGVKEAGEEAAAFLEDAAQDFWDGEDELAVRDFVADRGGNPFAGGADAALVAGGTEVAAFAGEGEESFVAAVGTLEPGETGGEVAAAEEGLDGGDGGGRERAEGFAVLLFVTSEEVVPTMVHELPKGGGTGAQIQQRRMGKGPSLWSKFGAFRCGCSKSNPFVVAIKKPDGSSIFSLR